MRHVRHGWRVPASLALILSLFPGSHPGLTHVVGQTFSGFTLRSKQHQAEDQPQGGLEETLRAAGRTALAWLNTPVTPTPAHAPSPATGLEEGVALPLDEASRTLETYRRAEGVNAVQVGPSGPVRRLFTQADNTLTPMSGDERTKLLKEVAVQNRVVLQHRWGQPLLVRAPTPEELRKAGVATGLEETPRAQVSTTLMALHLFFANLAEEVLSKDGLPKPPTGFSRAVKRLLPSYQQHGLDLSAEDVTELLMGHRRTPPQRLELEQATLLAWADLVVTELGNRFLEGRSVGDVDGILSAVSTAAKAFTSDDVKYGSMMWARYAVSPSDASLRGLIQRLQAQFHLTTGLEENDQAAARAAAEAVAQLEAVTRAWDEARTALPATVPPDDLPSILVFHAVPETDLDLLHYAPVAVMAEVQVLVIAPSSSTPTSSASQTISVKGQTLKTLLDTLPAPKATYFVVATPREAAEILTAYDHRKVKEVDGVFDLQQIFGIPIENEFPSPVGDAAARTQAYFKAQQAGLESGA